MEDVGLVAEAQAGVPAGLAWELDLADRDT